MEVNVEEIRPADNNTKAIGAKDAMGNPPKVTREVVAGPKGATADPPKVIPPEIADKPARKPALKDGEGSELPREIDVGSVTR